MESDENFTPFQNYLFEVAGENQSPAASVMIAMQLWFL
jgi:hypothetical protein